MSFELESMRIFVRVAELGSFTRAGDQLGIAKAKVSLKLKALEDQLGAQLLQRSTRVVRLTPEGEELLPRARQWILDAEEMSALYRPSVKGRVRIDLPVNFARGVLIPKLPDLLSRHPELELVLSTTDRRVDPLREGFDCVLRVGSVGDSTLMSRKLGVLPMVNCASPEYLRKHGLPQRVEDLDAHWLVNYSSTLGVQPATFEYFDGKRYRERPMRSALTVNTADAYQAACLAGLGIIQAPRIGVTIPFAAGTMVEILPGFVSAPLPMTLLHTHGKSVPRRVRVVMAWIAQHLSVPTTEAQPTKRP